MTSELSKRSFIETTLSWASNSFEEPTVDPPIALGCVSNNLLSPISLHTIFTLFDSGLTSMSNAVLAAVCMTGGTCWQSVRNSCHSCNSGDDALFSNHFDEIIKIKRNPQKKVLLSSDLRLRGFV